MNSQQLVNRYYDPATGQFLSVDPLVDVTGQAFAYTGDNPVNAVDPLGLWGWNPISDATQAWNDTGGKAVHATKVAAVDTGQFVYQHASTLSTIASGLATAAYISCAVTEGVGCGVGLALSAVSTSLAGVNTYRACFGGGGGCSSATVGLGLSVLATGTGAYLQGAASAALNADNAFARDIFLARQAGLIGAGANGLSSLYGLADYLYNEFNSSLIGCDVP